MGTNRSSALDCNALQLTGAEHDLALIIAEETERERRLRQAVAQHAPERTPHTWAELEAMSWDELLVLDGECFIRVFQRAELPLGAILDFIEQECEPANSLAMHWFGEYVRALNERSLDAQSAIKDLRSGFAKAAIEARHDRPGGSRWKRKRILEIWASGKYSTKQLCAEEEAAALGMSFDTARKALQGAPEPPRSPNCAEHKHSGGS